MLTVNRAANHGPCGLKEALTLLHQASNLTYVTYDPDETTYSITSNMWLARKMQHMCLEYNEQWS